MTDQENKTQFPNIKRELEKENQERLNNSLDKLNLTQEDINKEIANGKDMYNHKTPTEVLNYVVRWTLDKRTNYKGTYEEQKEKAIKGLKRKYAKALNQELSHLNSIAAAEIKNRLVITIEWKRSYMWGSNPIATDNYRFTSGSIGGYGYDKKSTATARILNQHLGFIKLMCEKKEKELNQRKATYKEQNGISTDSERGINHFLFGYGSGYGIIPHFEGGVGVSCHQSIMERLGFNMECIASTNNTDVYLITKKD